MHLIHIPQCTIQNRNVRVFVLNGVLLDVEQVNCGICEITLDGNLEHNDWKQNTIINEQSPITEQNVYDKIARGTTF